MSKLTTKDLMIGNWVCFDGDTEHTNPVQIDGISTEEACVDGDWYDVWKPIPLTTEILEKNFPMQNPQIESKWVKWWNFNDAKNGFYFEIDTPNNKCDGPILNMDFKYVHQLQQALKLCGIEKEIEL